MDDALHRDLHHDLHRNLRHDVRATLMPGFVGFTPPTWLLDALGATGSCGAVGSTSAVGDTAPRLLAVCVYGGNIRDPRQLRKLSSALREASPDALIAIDEEGGEVTRLHYLEGSPYPGAAVLGRIDDLDYTAEIGARVGRDLLAHGFNFTLAPDVDVNSNPENPVIGTRSFGADAERVSRHAAAWVRGLEATGARACPKHFPGHGDTSQDSHLQLPVVDASLATLAERDLPPFIASFEAGARAVMTSHILLPEVDATAPATFSRVILQDILRGELGFTGVVVSDALDMQGASGEIGIPEAAVRALAAGCDLLCLGTGTTFELLLSIEDHVLGAVRDGRLDETRIRDAANRVRELARGSMPSAGRLMAASRAGAPYRDASRRDTPPNSASRSEFSLADASRSDDPHSNASPGDKSNGDASKTEVSFTNASRRNALPPDTSSTDTSRRDTSSSRDSNTDVSRATPGSRPIPGNTTDQATARAEIERIARSFAGVDAARAWLTRYPRASVIRVDVESNMAVGYSPWGPFAARTMRVVSDAARSFESRPLRAVGAETPLPWLGGHTTVDGMQPRNTNTRPNTANTPGTVTLSTVTPSTVTPSTVTPDTSAPDALGTAPLSHELDGVIVIGRNMHLHAFARAGIDALRASGAPVLTIETGWPATTHEPLESQEHSGADENANAAISTKYADLATYGSSALVGAAVLELLAVGTFADDALADSALADSAFADDGLTDGTLVGGSFTDSSLPGVALAGESPATEELPEDAPPSTGLPENGLPDGRLPSDAASGGSLTSNGVADDVSATNTAASHTVTDAEPTGGQR